ncbi:hypothetical protein ACU4GI_33090 [Cupriavidus basilensis]
MKINSYFIALGFVAVAFSVVGCGKSEENAIPKVSEESRDYREIYRKDEALAQRDWADCKAATQGNQSLSDKCKMARQYGQQAYKAPAPAFSSKGGSQ